MTQNKKAVFMGKSPNIDRVFGNGLKDKLSQMCQLHPEVITQKNFQEKADVLADTEVIFSTWGMLDLTEEQIAKMPKLKALFYAAGAVKGFAPSFLNSGVKVFSAWEANAVPVAEFSLATIIFGLKQAYPCMRDNALETKPYQRPPILGAYETTVGIISLGMIGRKVCELLKNLQVNVVAYDPFVSDKVFEECNARRMELDQIFRKADIVSLHAPNLESTKGLITGEHFAAMKQHATFINTARGAVVNQEDLVQVLKKRPDLSAHLDVVVPGNEEELIQLPNVYLTPHIAGSLGNEVWRMAEYMIAEFANWQNGEKLSWEVTEDMLDKMA